ncbi:MAG: hypothetical protein KIS71_03585 [Bacteroidetes bacterium]|nr:hypothetical protein [Bacteroidota bacterium]
MAAYTLLTSFVYILILFLSAHLPQTPFCPTYWWWASKLPHDSAPPDYFNYNNQSPLFMDSTACTDCWSITKTAGTDTAAAFTDTVTYTITVCNNSVNTQTGIPLQTTPLQIL